MSLGPGLAVFDTAGPHQRQICTVMSCNKASGKVSTSPSYPPTWQGTAADCKQEVLVSSHCIQSRGMSPGPQGRHQLPEVGFFNHGLGDNCDLFLRDILGRGESVSGGWLGVALVGGQGEGWTGQSNRAAIDHPLT